MLRDCIPFVFELRSVLIVTIVIVIQRIDHYESLGEKASGLISVRIV